MKRLIAVLIFAFFASASGAERQAQRDKIMDRIADDIFAGREPLLKSCQEHLRYLGTALGLVKSFSPERVLKKLLDESQKTEEECSRELMWYNVHCADRVDVTDGTVTKGVAVNKPACRSHSRRAAACEDATEAYRSAMSELLAWRQTYSEAAKIRAATFEDKFTPAAKQCAQGK